MGKQINYYLGYEAFLKIAQAAIDCGCMILKPTSGKLICGSSTDLITRDQSDYYFYVPEAGELQLQIRPNGAEYAGGYNASGNMVIEAGFATLPDGKRILLRKRLFVISGYYGEDGVYIPRPDCVTKVYNKLVRVVKKVAPCTEVNDTHYDMGRGEKVYISPSFLQLKQEHHYELRASL